MSSLPKESTRIPAHQACGIWIPTSQGQPHADLKPSCCLGVSDGRLWPVSSAHDIICIVFIASLGGKEVFSSPFCILIPKCKQAPQRAVVGIHGGAIREVPAEAEVCWVTAGPWVGAILHGDILPSAQSRLLSAPVDREAELTASAPVHLQHCCHITALNSNISSSEPKTIQKPPTFPHPDFASWCKDTRTQPDQCTGAHCSTGHPKGPTPHTLLMPMDTDA